MGLSWGGRVVGWSSATCVERNLIYNGHVSVSPAPCAAYSSLNGHAHLDAISDPTFMISMQYLGIRVGGSDTRAMRKYSNLAPYSEMS